MRGIEMIDLNEAPIQQEYSLIPAGTIAKVKLRIIGKDSSYITTSKDRNSEYLNCEFIILEGPYKNRKVFDNFGIKGLDIFVNMGRFKIRSLLESFHGISPNNMSDTAKSKRMINDYGQLDGLTVVAEIGIRKANPEKGYDKRNNIFRFLTIDNKEYADVMGMKDFNHRSNSTENEIDNSIPF